VSDLWTAAMMMEFFQVSAAGSRLWECCIFVPTELVLSCSRETLFKLNSILADIVATRDVYPGCRIRSFSIPDPGSDFFYPRSRIRIKEFKCYNTKNWFLSSRKYDPGCSSRIRIQTFYLSRIPDPRVKKALDPGSHRSGSAILLLRTEDAIACNYCPIQQCSGAGAGYTGSGSGSGSTSQRYRSGSFYHHAKIVRKPLIPSILWLFLTFYFEKWCKCTFKK
jgi:hypothetical protein